MHPLSGTPFAFWITSMAYWGMMLETASPRRTRRR